MAGLPGAAGDQAALPDTGPGRGPDIGPDAGSGAGPDSSGRLPDGGGLPAPPRPGTSRGGEAGAMQVGGNVGDTGGTVSGVSVSGARLNHRRAAGEQELWLGFGGQADQFWLRLLAPGFRHCFAALRDPGGWTVLDPLSGRLLVTRLAVPAAFDLPGFWRRAGHRVLGPYRPAPPRAGWPWPAPANCVGVVRALLGPGAPAALTPRGLYRGLIDLDAERMKKKTSGCVKVFLTTGPAGR